MRVNGKSNGASEGRRLNIRHLFNPIGFRILPPPSFFSIPFSLWKRSTPSSPPTKKGRREIFPIFRDEWISRQKLDKKRKRNIHGVETLFFLVVNCNSRMDIIKNTLSVGRKKRTPLETDAFFLPWDLVLQISSRGFEAERRRCKKKKNKNSQNDVYGRRSETSLPSIHVSSFRALVLFRPLGHWKFIKFFTLEKNAANVPSAPSFPTNKVGPDTFFIENLR